MTSVAQDSSAPFSVRVLYIGCLTFLLGIGVGTFFTISIPTLVWCMTIVFALALITRRTTEVHAWEILTILIVLGSSFSVGVFRVSSALEMFREDTLAPLVGTSQTIIGTIVREPEARAKQQLLYIDSAGTKLLVSVDRFVDVSYGDQVSVTGVLKKPETFVTDLGREFDYPGYLKAKGVAYQISFAEIEVLQVGEGNPVIAFLLQSKQSLMQRIEARLPEPASGLGEGLLLGVKQALGTELEEAFRKTGLTHIVVLSGYNVMLVVAFVMYVLRYVLPPRPRIVVGIIAITLFALMVGLSATVVRATIMASILLLAEALGRLYLVLRALLIAGTSMVAINPLLLVYDIGFQLSFMATLGLVLVAPYIEGWLTTPTWFAPLRAFLTATIATQIAVLPLLLYHIGELSVVSVVVNVLVLPMVPVAMFLTFLLGSLGDMFAPVVSLVAYPAYLSLTYITTLATWFSEIPYAAISVPPFKSLVVLCAYAGMGLWLYKYRHLLTAFGQGELGENYVRQSVLAKSTSEDFTTWTIEEEAEDYVVGTKKAQDDHMSSRAGGVKKDTPIFFR